MYALNRRASRASREFLAAHYLQNVRRGRGASTNTLLRSSHSPIKTTIFDAPRSLSIKQTFSTNPTFYQSPPIFTPEEEGEIDLVEKTNIYKVLRDGEPGPILKVMGDPKNAQAVASMPDGVFVSALLRLTPEYFIEPFVKILQPVHEWHLKNKNLNTIDSILDEFFECLHQIIQARLQDISNSLGLVEYRHLLRISASIGDMKTVSEIWNSMRTAGIKPDLQCYNSYLHACVWDSAVYSLPRYRLRVSPYYYRQRSRHESEPKFRGFGTAGRSVRKQVYSMILDMREANLPLDEDTYINMLLASARVGSREGMEQVLGAIWGIDVPTITNSPPENLPHITPKPIAGSSPLYPSRKLLFAVAHAYGCNSMFEESLKLVQYLSKQYGIEITDDIWAEFFERGFVLSRNRGGRYGPALRLGQISTDVLDDIEKMLQLDGRTYDMNVYRMLATTAVTQKRHIRYEEVLRKAYNLLRETRRKRNHALSVLENYLGVSLRTSFSSCYPIHKDRLFENFSTPHVYRALRKYELLRLLVEQQQKTMEKMAGIVTTEWRLMGDWGSEWSSEWSSEWVRRTLPKFIAEWKDFLPESYKVALPDRVGTIEFLGRTSYKDVNIRMHYNDPVRWSDCGGGFVAEENVEQTIEISHDVLWAHFKTRFGDLASRQPFASFIRKAWIKAPSNFLKMDAVDHPTEEENEEPTVEAWQQEKMSHAFYVTLEPLFTPVSL